MIPIQNAKIQTLYDGSLATNNSTYYSVDASGYRSCTFIVNWDKPTATNSSVTLTTCTFAGGNTTSLGTSIATGTTGTSPVASQYTFPINNNTSLYSEIHAHIRNDTGYKYLGALVTPSSTSFKNVTITAVLTEPIEGPVSYTYTTGTNGKSFIA